MKSITIIAALAITVSAASAQTATRTSPLERAVETAAVANCKVDWLRKGGTGTRSPAFFGFMAECLSKSASR